MRVLWFTNTESNYSKRSKGYNGGGWISSLETQIRSIPAIQLAVSFITSDMKAKDIQNMYYPIKNPYNKSVINKLKGIIANREHKDEVLVSECIKVIGKFKPDIIEVFGSENSFGLICNSTNIPVILHIQGIINPCFLSFLPPSYSLRSYLYHSLQPLVLYRERRGFDFFKYGAVREKTILKSINYFFGRTEWDRRMTLLFNKNAKYYHCDEILRQEFYQEGNRSIPDKLVIISTISSPIYKGYDVILKTARILKELCGVDFKWIVYGNVIRHRYLEKSVGVMPSDVNVILSGVADAATLRESLLGATCFVHPSYIDNSPNSVCEAQILGCPVISTNVGGISSLIENGISGFLVPSNDPHQMAYLIMQVYTNKSLNERIGREGREKALYRHNEERIVKVVVDTYSEIVESKC